MLIIFKYILPIIFSVVAPVILLLIFAILGGWGLLVIFSVIIFFGQIFFIIKQKRSWSKKILVALGILEIIALIYSAFAILPGVMESDLRVGLVLLVPAIIDVMYKFYLSRPEPLLNV